MSRMLDDINKEIFKDLIENGQKSIIVVSTDNCPPCERLKEELEELEDKFEEIGFQIYKSKGNDDIERAILKGKGDDRDSIHIYPTTFVIRGNRIRQIIGGIDAGKLLNELKDNIDEFLGVEE